MAADAMRLATLSDKALVESIINDPAIRRFTARDGDGFFDAERFLAKPSFVVLVEGGCFVLHAVSPARYIVHTNLLPSCRGRAAFKQAEQALGLVFAHTDCEELYTMVPRNNPAARWFATRNGFRLRFERRGVWPQGGAVHDMEYFSMPIDEWVLRGACGGEGERFHAALHALAPEVDFHPDDPVHDAYVGAAFQMIAAGRVVKGVSLYNRWARLAGYAPVKVVGKEPLRIDIRDCVLKLEPSGEFSVEGRSCQ